MKIEKNVNLSSLTTINIGGNADLVWLENIQDFEKLQSSKRKWERVFLIPLWKVIKL